MLIHQATQDLLAVNDPGSNGNPTVVGQIALAVAFAAFGISRWIRDRKRRRALLDACATRGWTFTSTDPTLIDRWGGAPFGRGHSRLASNVVTGTHDGRNFISFDYRYKTTETDSKGNRRTSTHKYRLCVLLNMGCDMPRLSVSPENVLGRAFGSLFNTDIKLESDEFNRAFTISADDRKFAYDVLHPRMMETLLAIGRDTSWRFQGWDMIAIANDTNSVEAVDRDLAVLDAVLDNIPAFVWQDRGVPVRPTISRPAA